MRSLLAALLLVLLPSSTLAASGPPPGLAGTLAIVASDSVSVTLHAEQTGGELVTLTVEHYCYADPTTFAGMEKVRFSGSADMTFNIGPRTYHGKDMIPTSCWAHLSFYFSSSRVVLLDYVTTL